VCQVRRAAGAVVQSWWLSPAAAEQLFRRTAKTIRYHQRRSAQACQSHTRAAERKLSRLGIKLSTLKRADSDTS